MTSHRESRAEEPALLTDPEAIARKEAENAVRQFDRTLQYIEASLDPERPFRLRLSTIFDLHRFALDGLSLVARAQKVFVLR